jgi:hypothetical protein
MTGTVAQDQKHAIVGAVAGALAIAALAMLSASPAHAGPDMTKSEEWKYLLGTWCMRSDEGDLPVVHFLDACVPDKHETKIIIGEDGYEWVDKYGETTTCRYISGKAHFDKTIAANTRKVACTFSTLFHVARTTETTNCSVADHGR